MHCILHLKKREEERKGAAPNKIMHLLIDPVPKICQKKIHGAQSECAVKLSDDAVTF